MNTPSKNHSSAGCWTCRLRRKKCSEARPVCEACAALDIECLYSDERPAWMDNGSRQRAMADRVKRDVKDRAAWRREKRAVRDIDNGSATISLGRAGTHIFSVAPAAAAAPEPAPTPASASPDTRVTTSPDAVAASLAPPSLDEERDLNLMMVYLDYVFPFLYPFCRPGVRQGGRGWLLVLLMKNKAVFHSALSVSSFFMAVVATTEQRHGAGHSACLAAMSSELHKQQELSLRELQRAIAAITARRSRSSEHLAESARVLESILQLLSFECVVQRRGSWHVHLDAALSLFEQIMDAEEEEGGEEKKTWSAVMARLSPFRDGRGPLHPAPSPFGSDQAALKFHVALLLFMDTVTSTTVEQPPRLLRFHRGLVRADNNADAALLDMHEVVGVANWVLLALAETAALAAWKKAAAAERRLAVAELLARAAPIEAGLRGHLARLEHERLERRSASAPHAAAEADTDAHAPPSYVDSAGRLGADVVSRLWAHGVLAYLLVVVNGWQPAAAAIRAAADQVLAEAAALPSASCLRVAAWPLCVAGCLAAGEAQRAACRGMVGAIRGGDLLFGSVAEALRIMEAVWAAQAAPDGPGGPGRADWDFGRCFSILGRRAFLL